MTTFQADLETVLADMTTARANLVATVQPLSNADLDRARRGGWPVRRVIEHVIQSEQIYSTVVAALREQPVSGSTPVSCVGQPVDEILCQMDTVRTGMLSALEGVDEAHFYELRRFGHEEYSVLSMLENIANHDREHADQVKTILASS